MRFPTPLVVSLTILLTTSCDFSGCNETRKEYEVVYQEYLDLREERYREWQRELAEWEVLNTFEQSKKRKEIERCLGNPYEYYK